MTKQEYASAMKEAIELCHGFSSTNERMRGFMLALLLDRGEKVALGELMRNADRSTTRIVLTVLGGWQKWGWREVMPVEADDFVAKISAQAHA